MNKEGRDRWTNFIRELNHQDASDFIPGKTFVCELHLRRIDYSNYSRHACRSQAFTWRSKDLKIETTAGADFTCHYPPKHILLLKRYVIYIHQHLQLQKTRALPAPILNLIFANIYDFLNGWYLLTLRFSSNRARKINSSYWRKKYSLKLFTREFTTFL